MTTAGTTYDPSAFWSQHPQIIRRPGHDEQESALTTALGPLNVSSILEVGVGSGRIGALVCGRWPNAAYTGIDLSADRLTEASTTLPAKVELAQADLLSYEPGKTFDLVIAVEVLMHVRPEDIADSVARLFGWSHGHVCTVDWTEPISGPVADHNFIHDYEALGLPAVGRTGLQSVHLAEV